MPRLMQDQQSHVCKLWTKVPDRIATNNYQQETKYDTDTSVKF